MIERARLERDVDKAIDICKRAIGISPDFSDAWICLSELYMKKERYDLAKNPR